jgi:hypothetical protein
MQQATAAQLWAAIALLLQHTATKTIAISPNTASVRPFIVTAIASFLAAISSTDGHS